MRDYLHKYFYVLGDNASKLWLLVGFFLIASVLELLSIGLVGPFIAAVASPELLLQYPLWGLYKSVLGIESDNRGLLLLGFIIIAAFYSKGGASFWIYKKIIDYAYRHQKYLRALLMSSYQSMPYQFHVGRNSASMINVINSHVTIFTNGLMVSSLRMVADIIVFIGIFGLLLYTNWIVTVSLSILLLSVFFVYNYFVRHAIEESGKDLADASRDIIKNVNQGVSGLKEIRVLGREKYFLNQVFKYAGKYSDAGRKYYALQILPRYLIESVMITFVIGLALGVIYFGENVDNFMATLGVFGMAALRLMPSSTVIIGGINNILNSKHILNELYDDLKEVGGIAHYHISAANSDGVGSLQRFTFEQSIVLDDIHFQYSGVQQKAIDGISFSVKKGQSIGLIGSSGAGKTTLVDLILGLYKPQVGDIMVDGTSIYKNIREWLDNVAYIPQEVFLIDDTLKKNIALGVSEELINNEKLLMALKMAQLELVVNNLPDGIDTHVGEKGVRLSGGQRQRVALARAFYHDRDVIVMDEATAALDNETEREVVKAIEGLKGETTVIVIAHRLSTVAQCDVIYKLESGRIVDSGSYEQVISGV